MKNIKYIISVFVFMLFSGNASAQTAPEAKSLYAEYQLEIVLGVAALVCFVGVLALFVALYALKSIADLEKPVEVKEEVQESYWQRLWNNMNKAVPIEKEATVMTSHEYDGIRELDNRLPPWWLYGFYFTIFFGVVYLLNYHVFNTGDLQQDEYEREMAEAKAEVETYLASLDNRIDENSVTFLDDQAEITAGREIYNANCLVCHGAEGQGVVGPNLADKYWIHGGDMVSIFKTIKYGVPEKGMIPWESQLTPKQMQQVSSFIYTLEGTNPANPKEPEGELFERSGNGEMKEGT